jgi:hypothetical protein
MGPLLTTSSPKGRLANWQIVALALWQLGGSTIRQATEDVAVSAWKLAPERFSWERYTQYPNLDTARVALSDAKKRKYGTLVDGDQERGWLLTSAGVAWAKNQGSTPGATSKLGPSALRSNNASALSAIEASRVFQSWATGEREFDVYELADAIQLPADAPRALIASRVDQLLNAATLADLTKHKEFLTWLKGRIGKAN